ncbi:TrkH family potassium uptake protein [Allofournierella massiliensis]|uniref:Trk system potassium uptake protein TrkH n=1 Tax=Allofournierella massiliensis TaxID=1650663 RepID=A0A4R1QRZ0_9FIRM|nr:potassium transporter TrkG [Fournierella massiliensis]TCL55791.1 trk system potassium uptake protein TrkH [Fournierella massiliensis]
MEQDSSSFQTSQLGRLISRTAPPPKKRRRLESLSPTRLIVSSFLVVIVTGALLLMLPFATRNGITPVQAFFTATSATCVTGLVVLDTYQGFTLFGQTVVICLIQIGGLSLVTLASFFTLALRRRVGFRSMKLASESIGTSNVAEARGLLLVVMKLAAFFEGLGFLLLLPVFVPEYGAEGIFISIFLSISAFCNAGFDILGRTQSYVSLMGYASDWYVQGIIMFLIVAGGLGFLVWHDLGQWRKTHHLSIHTKVVLFCTILLIVGGTVGFAFLEWNNPATLGGMTAGDKIVNSLFQSISARTAGFNTIDLASMSSITKCMLCVLMFIGAAPGGTGGGIKVTTFSVILVTVASVVTGREDAQIFRRRIDKKTVYQALSIAMLSLGVVIFVTLVVFFNCGEVISPLDCLYEVVSAFGTVGCSVGVTGQMHPLALIITMITMFIGRVGPVSLAISLASQRREQGKFDILPEGKISVG